MVVVTGSVTAVPLQSVSLKGNLSGTLCTCVCVCVCVLIVRDILYSSYLCLLYEAIKCLKIKFLYVKILQETDMAINKELYCSLR